MNKEKVAKLLGAAWAWSKGGTAGNRLNLLVGAFVGVFAFGAALQEGRGLFIAVVAGVGLAVGFPLVMNLIVITGSLGITLLAYSYTVDRFDKLLNMLLWLVNFELKERTGYHYSELEAMAQKREETSAFLYELFGKK